MSLHPLFQEICEAHGAPAAVPYIATAFEAFKVDGSFVGSDKGTYRLGRIGAGTLREALNEALSRFALYHKDTLILRESGESGTKLRLFAIRKKATPRYVHKDHVTRAVRDLYADPICVIDAEVIGASK